MDAKELKDHGNAFKETEAYYGQLLGNLIAVLFLVSIIRHLLV